MASLPLDAPTAASSAISDDMLFGFTESNVMDLLNFISDSGADNEMTF